MTPLVAVVMGQPAAVVAARRKAANRELAAKLIRPSNESARLADLTPERIQAALAAIASVGRAAQTVNHYRAATRAFCRWARGLGRLRDNPAEGVTGLNVERDRRHRRRVLTRAELARLVEAAAAGKGDVAVASALNESGIPAPRGGLWGKSTVRRILNCPAYLGTSVARAGRAAATTSSRASPPSRFGSGRRAGG